MRTTKINRFISILKLTFLAVALILVNRFIFSLIRSPCLIVNFPTWLISGIEGLLLSMTLFCLAYFIHKLLFLSPKELLLFSLVVLLSIWLLPPLIFKIMVYLSPSGEKIPPILLQYGILLQPYLVYFLSYSLASLIFKWSDLKRKWLYAGLFGFLSFFYFSLCDIIPVIKGADIIGFLIVIFYSIFSSIGGIIGGLLAENLVARSHIR